MLKKGAQGPQVKELQSKLVQLGYDIKADGIFGDNTDKTVKTLQQTWGYDIDGVVGKGTEFLIDKRIKEGWNLKQPDALDKAKQAAMKQQTVDTQPQKK